MRHLNTNANFSYCDVLFKLLLLRFCTVFFKKNSPALQWTINKKINLSIEYFDRLFLVSALDSFKIQIILYNCSFWFRRRWSNLIPWPYAIKLKLRCYHSCWREIFLHAPPKCLQIGNQICRQQLFAYITFLPA